MSKVNRGKDFETAVKQSFQKVPNTSIIRLIDPQNGYAGVRNICDFIVYHYPYQYMIECKSCYGNTLPFANITDNQWNGLLEVSDVPGVISGYMIWFIDRDVTVFVPARDAEKHKTKGAKSIKWNDFLLNEIFGEKKRIMFDYDMGKFFDEVTKNV